jgi:DNA repair exonuclease SbcCD ATPase subunit
VEHLPTFQPYLVPDFDATQREHVTEAFQRNGCWLWPHPDNKDEWFCQWPRGVVPLTAQSVEKARTMMAVYTQLIGRAVPDEFALHLAFRYSVYDFPQPEVCGQRLYFKFDNKRYVPCTPAWLTYLQNRAFDEELAALAATAPAAGFAGVGHALSAAGGGPGQPAGGNRSSGGAVVYLQWLKVQGWCQHRALEVQFGRLTSLRGPNGAGKTNLLNALVYAFTGDNRNPGVKDDNISQLITKNAEAGVWVGFTHKGATCELHRGLVPARQHLIVNGVKYTKNPEVRAQLRKLLGVEDSLLLNYVFVPQWGMFDFISQRSGERAAAFAQLFGTAPAAYLWADVLAKPPLPEVRVSVDGQAVQARLHNLRLELDVAVGQLTAASVQLEHLQAQAAERQALLAAYELRGLRAPDLDRLTDALQQATQERASKRTVALAAAEAVQAARQELTAAELTATQARQTLEAWAAHELRVQFWRGVQTEAAAAAQHVGQLQQNVPQPPAEYVHEAKQKELAAEQVREQTRVEMLQRFINSCDPARGVAACPTCGTSTQHPDLALRLTRAQQALPLRQARLQQLRLQLESSRQFDRTHNHWLALHQAAAERLTRAQQKLVAHPEPPPPATAKQAARQVLQAAERARGRHAELEARSTAATTAYTRAEMRWDTLQQEHQVLTETLASLPEVAVADYQAARTARDEAERLAREVGAAQERCRQLRLGQAECDDLLARYETEYRQFWAVRRVAEQITAARDLLHRDRLPAEVSRYFLEKMRARINQALADFDDPFTVTGVENEQFVIRFADGRVQTAARLSGGEKMVLGLVFRLAVNSMFAGDLGLLCLDEPTAGLTEHNRARLYTALERFKAVTATLGLQVVLVTHDPGLDNVCDRVIELAG